MMKTIVRAKKGARDIKASFAKIERGVAPSHCKGILIKTPREFSFPSFLAFRAASQKI